MNIGSAKSGPANHEPEATDAECDADNSDAALVTFDFAEAFASGDEGSLTKAVFAFQELLGDPQACRARAALLRKLRARAGELQEAGFNMPAPARQPDELDRCVRLIAEVGTFVALERGDLTYDDLVAVSLDPERLWEAHRRVCMLDEEPG